jgi:hypothetical protein
MGNGIETSEVPYPTSPYHRFQTTLCCKSRPNLGEKQETTFDVNPKGQLIFQIVIFF